MIEQTTVTVKGEEYTIESFTTTKSLQVLAKLSRIVGGVGEGVIDWPQSKAEVRQALHLGNMVNGVLARIDPEEAPAFIRDVMWNALPAQRNAYQNNPAAFQDWYENHFSRNLDAQVQLLKEIFEWNYGPVVEWAKKAIEASLRDAVGMTEVAPDTDAGGSPQQSSTS